MSNKFLSCNGPGYSPAQMVSGYLHSFSKFPDWLHFDDRNVIFTYQGRYAIGLLCKFLKIGLGDEIIMPAYNCGAEVDPFIQAGAKVIFYRIFPNTLIDTEDIIRRVTPATRIIYVTHFFGWPQEIIDLAKWCRKRGIFLVEDCAQSLFSNGPDNTIGQIGDASIYSFVKSLALPDGGALVFKENILNKGWKYRHHRPNNTLLNSLPLFKKWFMNNNKYWQHHELTRKLLTKSWFKKSNSQKSEFHPEMLKSNNFIEQRMSWPMSRISMGRLKSTNPNDITEKRRRNYMYLQNALLNIPAFSPVFEVLPNDVCPLSFPFLAKDRNLWNKALSDKGILVQGWPGYYPGFDWDNYPEACNLKDNLIALPVHQGLDSCHMEYIADCVKQIAEKICKSSPC